MADAPDSRRTFAPLWDDYAFFEAHTDEADRNLEAWCAALAGWLPRRERVRLLDFGTGSGRVLEMFLQRAGLAPDKTELTLLEPDAAQRAAAVRRLASRSTRPVTAVAGQGALDERTFDLITSHHVLYYVRDLEAELRGLWDRLAPDGRMLVSLAGRARSQTIKFWYDAYGHLGREVPCLNADHFQAALERLGLPYEQRQVSLHIDFEDTPANRLRIPRFLMGEDYAALGDAYAAAWWEPHARDGRIVVEEQDEFFIVTKD
ncbi:MAG: methyltransferase domain-containing protein [Verrucomicrobiota bacterium]